MSRISRVNYLARQTVLGAVPFALALVDSVGRLAETRLRRTMAISRHVSGSGIEIGAAVSPSVLPLGSHVRYVDWCGTETLKADKELGGYNPVHVDIVDSAERLAKIDDRSVDFVLAMHVFEHLQDPIRALLQCYRVTRGAGIIVLAVPDKRQCRRDSLRPETSYGHLLIDYEQGPDVSRTQHFQEVGQLVRGLSGPELERFIAESTTDPNKHTHFHVWSAEGFLEFVQRSRTELGLGLELVEFASYGHETLVVLRVNRAGEESPLV